MFYFTCDRSFRTELVVAVRSSLPQTLDEFSVKSLTFDHFLCENGQTAFSLPTPTKGSAPWTPLVAPAAPIPLFRLALRALAMVPSWHFLDPPLFQQYYALALDRMFFVLYTSVPSTPSL